jgi:hypothetical protein
VGKSTRYFNGSTKKDKVVRSASRRGGLLYSVASNAVDAMTATSRRVLMDGPVANKSFIAGASYQLKVLAAWVQDLKDYHHEGTKNTKK